MGVYACSDLHGEYKLWQQIKEFLTNGDILYFLGDAIDRNKEGWLIVDEIRKMDNVIYITGNHEKMAAAAFHDIVKYGNDIDELSCCWAYNRWSINDGPKNCPDEILFDRDKLEDYIAFFESLPVTKEIFINKKKIILDHSGFVYRQLHWYSHEDTWDREHFTAGWDLENEKNTYMVHGHTPTWFIDCKLKNLYAKYPYPIYGYEPLNLEWNKIEEYRPKIIRYCEGHKFNIDMGSYFTHTVALLDLNNFKEIYFYDNSRKS